MAKCWCINIQQSYPITYTPVDFNNIIFVKDLSDTVTESRGITLEIVEYGQTHI